jgi:hypothetical protein
MTPHNKIRFVHGNHEMEGPRFTIAYHRDENFVIFAFTNLYFADQYVRSEGRRVSEQNLLNAFEQNFKLKNSLKLMQQDKEVGFFNPTYRIGGLYLEAFEDDLSSILADHVVSQLNLMDLKHSYISSKLFDLVYNYNYNNVASK